MSQPEMRDSVSLKRPVWERRIQILLILRCGSRAQNKEFGSGQGCAGRVMDWQAQRTFRSQDS